ncbi:hypothetical protein [Brucella pseudintermedia]|uniref:hypothetical protein n=1 Tax=Brucella pseudintermedia TaxID=370111 RepID=UPI001F30AA17|nr:hypothetical protein [Brucella pseudintermedia]
MIFAFLTLDAFIRLSHILPHKQHEEATDADLLTTNQKHEEQPIMSQRRSSKPRLNEIIGGGFFVFRRGKKTGRVGVFTTMPYEHGSFEQALAEATRLAALCPGETFEVFQTSGAVACCTPVVLAEAA